MMKSSRPANDVPARAVLGQRGYILIALSFSLLFLLGMTGLAVDVGRMYIAKNEAQSFVDSMALTTATKLNGDKSGLVAADSAVTSGLSTKLWHLGTTPFAAADTKVEYSSSSDPGNWQLSGSITPGAAVAGVFPEPVPTDRTRVTTTVHVPLYFVRVLVGSTASTVRASATAVRSAATSYGANTNVIPFSPISHKSIGIQIDDANDPFGFKVGQYYTLRWDKNNTTGCAGDVPDVQAYAQGTGNGNGKGNGNGSTGMDGWLGSVCQGASTCNQALDGNGLDYGITTGNMEIPTKEGVAQSIVHASDARVASDPDHAASYFGDNGYAADGTGNGRRIVTAPVNTGVVTGNGSNSYAVVTGFGAFMMMDSSFGGGAVCGQYLGTVVPGQPFSGGVSPGNPAVTNAAYSVRLAQ